MLRMIALSIGLMISSLSVANAATYRIDGFINISQDGFGSTLFHEATGCGGMCGTSATNYHSDGTGSGFWNSSTGAINFVMNMVDGGVATVSGGTLNLTSRTDGAKTGLAGMMQIVISGSTGNKNGTYDFSFADTSHNPVANWFHNDVLGLWGGAPASGSQQALGVDFRIAVSEVPLPAGAILLLSCIGGMGLYGRRRAVS